MSHPVLGDVFTADELARAARGPRPLVEALLDSGDLQQIAGTRFIAGGDALRAAQQLRDEAATAAAAMTILPAALFSGRPDHGIFRSRRRALSASASTFIHSALLLGVLWWTAGPIETAPAAQSPDKPRMVFLVSPGPGGGGGGGGERAPRPAAPMERRGTERARLTVPVTKPERVLTTARRVEEPPKPTPAVTPPKPVERAPEPLLSRAIVAPVVPAAANERDRAGVIESARETVDSQGSGLAGGAGSGQGTGSGEGLGAGIGSGSGGGTGGGPYRPGSGIEPPRLLREIKAEYTDEARRRGVTGDVLLEIVVRRDGTVGEVTLLQGLGAGLDQRAVAAVRQWRFSPARRTGEPVDVVVEVAVEFTLR